MTFEISCIIMLIKVSKRLKRREGSCEVCNKRSIKKSDKKLYECNAIEREEIKKPKVKPLK